MSIYIFDGFNVTDLTTFTGTIGRQEDTGLTLVKMKSIKLLIQRNLNGHILYAFDINL
ncbi:hypothetical protein Glove_606g177 [Diversispora epigaea]|uniref:Uncharacterized protein n=1 Tax=Diversispora epigaea TaxID=1348612 RepID=A0A397G758_9GLOM|nr:hypothetical protein Glove_606g177 [Diversispora epigaea]